MSYSSDNSKLLLLTSSINILLIFIMNYDIISIFILLNLLSINLILLNDIYFEIKNKFTHINFNFMPKFYPSFRTSLNYLWYLNIISLSSGVVFTCFDFWMNNFQVFKFIDKSYYYIVTLIIIITITNLITIILIIVLVYYCIKFISIINNLFTNLLFNFINNQPLLDNIINKNELNFCWICERNLNKHKMLKKVNCPCNEHFHPECIDKYLSLYNNYCRAGHKISKYEHTA
jgi:hypothetical protein